MSDDGFSVSCNPEKAEILDAIELVSAYVSRFPGRDGVSHKIRLVLEECLINILSYAFPDKTDDARIVIEAGIHNNYVFVRITDNGLPFDLRAYHEKPEYHAAETAQVGGLGIAFIKKYSKEICYSRTESENIITLYLQECI